MECNSPHNLSVTKEHRKEGLLGTFDAYQGMSTDTPNLSATDELQKAKRSWLIQPIFCSMI